MLPAPHDPHPHCRYTKHLSHRSCCPQAHAIPVWTHVPFPVPRIARRISGGRLEVEEGGGVREGGSERGRLEVRERGGGG